MVPLSLWLPFVRYRQSHLQHHRDDRLTDPFDDPESYYWAPEELARFSAPTRALLLVNQTLAGRMIVGPVWTIGRFFHFEWRALRQNESNVRRVWLEHLLWCVPVVLWLKFVCGMPLWVYVVDDDPAGHGDRVDPILRRASGAPGSARAHRDRRTFVVPRTAVPVQQSALAPSRGARHPLVSLQRPLSA